MWDQTLVRRHGQVGRIVTKSASARRVMNASIGFALSLSALAGLSTTLGGLLGITIREPGPRFMSFTLGFSGGVMILVSFVELLGQGIEVVGFGPAYLAFLGGMMVMFVIDVVIPHEYMAERYNAGRGDGNNRLLKTGLFVALGIAVHNFPEGMASLVGALEDPFLGIAIAIAVALHNIPEGLAVAAPVYAATGSRGRALLWSFLSGLAEPIGAALAAAVLMPFLSPAVLGYVLAVVAGIMVFISLDELVPVASSFGKGHLSILGVVLGMSVMALSLWLQP